MISQICADVLKELKRLGTELPLEQEIVLHEFEESKTTIEVPTWKKKNPLTLT